MPINQNAHNNRARGMSPHETLFTWRYQNGEEESHKEEGSEKESNEEENCQKEKIGLRIVQT